jgi:hypothetical protein
MRLLVAGAQQWRIVLMGQGLMSPRLVHFCFTSLLEFRKMTICSYKNSGFFHVGLVKMESHILLNGMKVKGLLKELIWVSGKDL